MTGSRHARRPAPGTRGSGGRAGSTARARAAGRSRCDTASAARSRTAPRGTGSAGRRPRPGRGATSSRSAARDSRPGGTARSPKIVRRRRSLRGRTASRRRRRCGRTGSRRIGSAGRTMPNTTSWLKYSGMRPVIASPFGWTSPSSSAGGGAGRRRRSRARSADRVRACARVGGATWYSSELRPENPSTPNSSSAYSLPSGARCCVWRVVGSSLARRSTRATGLLGMRRPV